MGGINLSTKKSQFETRSLSSLKKVFSDEDLLEEAYTKGSALYDEVYAFQID